jgi:HTH-type transcriptional regulator / antitoxin HigA
MIMVENMNGLSLDLLSHPGETLKDALEENEMSQKELAARLNLSEKHISKIINGTEPISNATALKLENVFHLPASFWNALQSKYFERREKLLQMERVSEEEVNLICEKTYKEIVKRKYINDTKDKRQKVLYLRNFFQISNLTNLAKVNEIAVQYRKVKTEKFNDFALATWMRICEIESQKIKTKDLNLENIRKNLLYIRSLSIKAPDTFIKELRDFFAENGVAFNIVQKIPGANVNGFIRKYKDKINISLNIRGAYSDIFWFTLFHELGHIFTHKIEKGFVDYKMKSDLEELADEFAASHLIDEEVYNKLIKSKSRVAKSDVILASKEMNISPGIIVGRLQHEKVIGFDMFNDLRTKYKWV